MEYFLLMRVKMYVLVVSGVLGEPKFVQLQMSGEGVTEYDQLIVN